MTNIIRTRALPGALVNHRVRNRACLSIAPKLWSAGFRAPGELGEGAPRPA